MNSRGAMHHWFACPSAPWRACDLKTSAVGRLATSAQPSIFESVDLKPDDPLWSDNLFISRRYFSLMLIKNVSILHSGQLLPGRDILIEEGKIAKMGRDLCNVSDDDEVIDGRGKLAMPGLINGHTHLAMTLLRGYADDMELMPWLQEKIWPLEAKITEEDVSLGSQAGLPGADPLRHHLLQ